MLHKETLGPLILIVSVLLCWITKQIYFCFKGNYDQYVKTREELEENQMKRFNWEQDQIAHMKVNLMPLVQSFLHRMDDSEQTKKWAFQTETCHTLNPPPSATDFTKQTHVWLASDNILTLDRQSLTGYY